MIRFKTLSGTTYELDRENMTIARLGNVPIMNTDLGFGTLEKTGEGQIPLLRDPGLPVLGGRFSYSTELYPYMLSTEVVEILEEV